MARSNCFIGAFKKATLGLATLATLTAGMLASPKSAQAFVDGNFRITVGANTNYVVDVAGDSLPTTTGVIQIHRKTTEFQKKSSTWFSIYDSKARSFEIHLTENPKLCLATAVGLNYAAMGEATPLVVTNNCAQANNWILENNQLKVSRKQELCADIAWAKIANYSKLQLIKCRPGHPAQTFVIERNGGNQPALKPAPVPLPKASIPIADRKVTIPIRPPNGTQVACGPVCGGAIGVVFTIIGEAIKDEYFSKRIRVHAISWNVEGATWDHAAKACDSFDNWGDKGFNDYFLIWRYNPKTSESEKTCVIFE
jgi:hypothetical protein